MNRKFLLLFPLLWAPFSPTSAQTNSPEVIATAGHHVATSNAQVSWTVGEMVTASLTNPTLRLTQGFHQTQLVVTSLEEPSATLQIQIFPNPTSEAVNIRTETARTMEIRLVDMSGKVLLEHLHDQQVQSELNLQAVSQGNYLLRVRDLHSNAIRHFKLQVIHTK